MSSPFRLPTLLGLFVAACVFGSRLPPAAASDAQGDEDDNDDLCDSPTQVSVQNVSFHVTLSDAHVYKVAGYVYTPSTVRHHTVQLLVHGASYNHLYWDAADINHRSYSYARAMARCGYPVVSIDLPGTGNSDKPDGDFFGLAEAASTLHQIAGPARAYGGAGAKLAYVGHSDGSVTSLYAQGTYGDADLVVSTGWVHGFRGLPVDPTDPALGQALQQPYIDFKGPPRNAIMYYAPKADPAMIAYDDANLADKIPRRQFLDLIGVHGEITALGPGGMTQQTRSQLVRVPTLVEVGERDDAIAPPTAGPPAESAFFPLVTDFTFHVVPKTGHCINLHLTRKKSWKAINAWLSARD